MTFFQGIYGFYIIQEHAERKKALELLYANDENSSPFSLLHIGSS